MTTACLIGALVIGIPLLVLAWVFLHRQRPVFYFAVALILVGLGYQLTTGASEDIGRAVLGLARDVSMKGDKSAVPATQAPNAPLPSEYPSK